MVSPLRTLHFPSREALNDRKLLVESWSCNFRYKPPLNLIFSPLPWKQPEVIKTIRFQLLETFWSFYSKGLEEEGENTHTLIEIQWRKKAANSLIWCNWAWNFGLHCIYSTIWLVYFSRVIEFAVHSIKFSSASTLLLNCSPKYTLIVNESITIKISIQFMIIVHWSDLIF